MLNSETDITVASTSSRIPKKFIAKPYSYHEEVTLLIDDLTNEGKGVGRHNGWVIMVPMVLPGETVSVRIYKNHPNYSEGDLVSVITASPDRVTPPCPYFMSCGGCQYQHMTVDSQREWKKNQVKTLLNRIGKIDNVVVNDTVGSADYYHYRTKLTPHYDIPKVVVTPIKIGFQQRGTRNIVDIEQCIIATPPINVKYSEFRTTFTESLKTKVPKKGATLLFREHDNGVETDFRATISQTVENIEFKFKAGEFFQNNAYVLPLMVQHVRRVALGDGCQHLIDTYCGSGLFALTLASSFASVIGIEVSDLAVTAARQTATANNISNVDFKTGSAEAIFKSVQHLPADNTVVVIDPPRKGCDEVFLTQLVAFNPKKVVYVSCDPATQARDAQTIVAAGYAIVDVTPFDLFPQTRHIENVITFIRE